MSVQEPAKDAGSPKSAEFVRLARLAADQREPTFTAYSALSFTHPPTDRSTITKNQNTFAKRQREMEKKRKAEDKLARRKERQLTPEEPLSEPSVEEALPTSDE